MRSCAKCGESKRDFDFAQKRGKPTSTCRACHRTYVNEYYARNAQKYRPAAIQRKNKARQNIEQLIRAAKTKPCADCDIEYPWYVMDFDHEPDEIKLFNLSAAKRAGYSVETVEREIAKCTVVCSNCHRQRTFTRDGALGNW